MDGLGRGVSGEHLLGSAACSWALLCQAGSGHLKQNSLPDNKWRLLIWLFICFNQVTQSIKQKWSSGPSPGGGPISGLDLSLAMNGSADRNGGLPQLTPISREQRCLPESHSLARPRQNTSGGTKFYK